MGSFWARDVGRPGMGGPSRALGCRSLPDASRRPSLTAEPGLVIPRGQPVSFRCQGPPGTELYRLKKEGAEQFMDLPAAEGGGLFSLETAPNTAGNYSCLYKIQTAWSEPSNTLQLVVTGLYEPPSLSALPGPNVTAGQNVTLRCQTELWFSSAALAKDGETVGFGSALHTGPGSRTDFLLAAVSDAQQGRYRCYSFHGAASEKWSSPSAPVELRLTGEAGRPSQPPSSPKLPHCPKDLLQGVPEARRLEEEEAQRGGMESGPWVNLREWRQ
uniref:Uncharacterized protein n=1 Tax=Monodelphis domestica TaxID=13616 RepID=H9H6R3_MONDO